jgi:hypothetical protein
MFDKCNVFGGDEKRSKGSIIIIKTCLKYNLKISYLKITNLKA